MNQQIPPDQPTPPTPPSNPGQPEQPQQGQPSSYSMETGMGAPMEGQPTGQAGDQQAHQQSYQQAGQQNYQQGYQQGYQQQGQPGAGGQGYYQQPYMGQPAHPVEQDINMTIMHALCFVAGWISPLIWMLAFKDKASPRQMKEIKDSLNFQLTFMILYLILFFATCGIGGLVVMIIMLVYEIKALIDSSNGKMPQYPYKWDMVK